MRLREKTVTRHISQLLMHIICRRLDDTRFSLHFPKLSNKKKQLKNIEKRFLTFSREVEWKLKEMEIYFDCRRCLLLLVLLFLNDLIFPSLFCFAAGFDTRNQSRSWQFGDTSKFNSSGR